MAIVSSIPNEERRRRKERLAHDLEEALAGIAPTHDELAGRPAKRGPRIQGLTAREFANRIGVQYQTVLVWLREYDPEFPAEHNWPKLADSMGLTLDEFRSRYLFSQPRGAPLATREEASRLEVEVESLRQEVAALRRILEERGETG